MKLIVAIIWLILEIMAVDNSLCLFKNMKVINRINITAYRTNLINPLDNIHTVVRADEISKKMINKKSLRLVQ